VQCSELLQLVYYKWLTKILCKSSRLLQAFSICRNQGLSMRQSVCEIRAPHGFRNGTPCLIFPRSFLRIRQSSIVHRKTSSRTLPRCFWQASTRRKDSPIPFRIFLQDSLVVVLPKHIGTSVPQVLQKALNVFVLRQVVRSV